MLESKKQRDHSSSSRNRRADKVLSMAKRAYAAVDDLDVAARTSSLRAENKKAVLKLVKLWKGAITEARETLVRACNDSSYYEEVKETMDEITKAAPVAVSGVKVIAQLQNKDEVDDLAKLLKCYTDYDSPEVLVSQLKLLKLEYDLG